MLHILEIHALPPDKRDAMYREALRQARAHLLSAQMFIGPMDERYKEIDDLIEWIEEELMKKQTPSS